QLPAERAAFDIPGLGCPVPPRRHRPLAIGRDRNGLDTLMSFVRDSALDARKIPEFERPVPAGRQSLPAVRRQGHRKHMARMPSQPAKFLAGFEVPDRETVVVLTRSNQNLAI